MLVWLLHGLVVALQVKQMLGPACGGCGKNKNYKNKQVLNNLYFITGENNE